MNEKRKNNLYIFLTWPSLFDFFLFQILILKLFLPPFMERYLGAPLINRYPSSLLYTHTFYFEISHSQALSSLSLSLLCSSAFKYSSHSQVLPRTHLSLNCSKAPSLIFKCFHTKHISLEEYYCSSCIVSHQGNALEVRSDY